MARYKLNPVFIEAVQYKAGMEDGFNFYPIMSGQFICSMTNEEMKTKPYPKANRIPFIETFYGRKQVKAGDYIITGEDGQRNVCDAKTFKDCYSPVVEPDLLGEPYFAW